MLFSQREQSSGVPAPFMVRTGYTRKLSRLRALWFLLGMLAGIAFAWCCFSVVHRAEYSREYRYSQSFALLERSLAPLPRPIAVAAPVPPALAKTTVVATGTSAAAKPQKTAAYGPPAPPAATKPAAPNHYSVAVRSGDTLVSLLMDKGVKQQEAYQAVQSMKKVYDPKRLTIGQSVDVHIANKDESGKPHLSGLSIAVSPLATVTVARNDNDSFTAHETKAPVFKGIAHAGGVIHSSLYQTGIDAGLSPQMLNEIIHAMSYDIDFARDIKEGDGLDVVYERMHTANNATAGYGNVLYASLDLGGREVTFYRHVSPDGVVGYYNAKGESVKKALLKTPINGARVTSGFGMRIHPLLGYSRMHKGIDFGAPTGTPIYAAGDGVIVEAGRKGGYGNYVRIKHSAIYSTAYGHASRIASGIRPGVHVKQGQIIAYVGSTGFSTGPHLHYEILVDGSQVNPAGVKFRTGQVLAGNELRQFKHEVTKVQLALNTTPHNTDVASLGR
jgi:murein DD-endopeptidase MepM/ murein hydrolase activator NlpD